MKKPDHYKYILDLITFIPVIVLMCDVCLLKNNFIPGVSSLVRNKKKSDMLELHFPCHFFLLDHWFDQLKRESATCLFLFSVFCILIVDNQLQVIYCETVQWEWQYWCRTFFVHLNYELVKRGLVHIGFSFHK